MDEEKWAQARADEVRERHRQKELRGQVLVAENSLKKAHAPELWSEIRSLMKRKAESFSKALGEEGILIWASVKANEAVIKIKDPPMTEVRASFDRETLKIECTSVNTLVKYSAKVKDGQVMFFSEEGPMTPDAIAERFVDSIVKFISL